MMVLRASTIRPGKDQGRSCGDSEKAEQGKQPLATSDHVGEIVFVQGVGFCGEDAGVSDRTYRVETMALHETSGTGNSKTQRHVVADVFDTWARPRVSGLPTLWHFVDQPKGNSWV